MAPQKALLAWRMHVFRIIGMDMVMTVVRGPPEWAALHGGGTDQGKQELDRSRGAKRLVGEIAVIEAGNREHSEQIEAEGDRHGDRTDTHPEYGQTGEVHGDKGNGPEPVHLAMTLIIRQDPRLIVKPAQERDEPTGGWGIACLLPAIEPEVAMGFYHCWGTLLMFATS